MITAQMRDYRNFLLAHEEDLINNKIKVETLEDWQKLYENLLTLEKKRRSWADALDIEAKNYLKPTDDYLNYMLTVLKMEMNNCNKNNHTLTDELAKTLFLDVVTLVTYDSILRKLQMLETVAKKEMKNFDSSADYTSYVNNFGVSFKISKKFASTYENLLLKQMELAGPYQKIIKSLIWADEKKGPVEEGSYNDVLLDYEFYHFLNFDGKKDYLEEIIKSIRETKAQVREKIWVDGKEYEIPRYLKPLFLEYMLQKRLIVQRINKREENFILDNQDLIIDEDSFSTDGIDIDILELPVKNIENLRIGEVTAKLVETQENINKIKALGQHANPKDTITYKDKEDVYIIPKKLEQEFLDMYALKLALVKKNGPSDRKRSLKNKINFLKEMGLSENTHKEMRRLAYLFKKEKQAEKLELEQKLDLVINCERKEVKEFYKTIIMNMPAFLHSTKMTDKAKIVYLKRMQLVIDKEETEILSLIARSLQSLVNDEGEVLIIEDIRKCKNIEKMSNLLKKVMPYVNNSLIYLKNNNFAKETLANSGFMHIDNLVEESKVLRQRANNIKKELDEEFLNFDLTSKFLERRNVEEIARLEDDDLGNSSVVFKTTMDLKEN